VGRLEVEEFSQAGVTQLPFTRGYPLWRLPVQKNASANMVRRYPLLEARTVLFDLAGDPEQQHPVQNPVVEARIRHAIVALLRANDAPPEIYVRYALEAENTPVLAPTSRMTAASGMGP